MLKHIDCVSGTREWAVKSVNCISGCSNGCRYCYGKAMARRFRRVLSDAEWIKPKLKPKEVNRKRHKMPGTVMFPTTHDITPEFLEPCLVVLKNLLEADNKVLVVSKPQLECIQRICQDFAAYKDHILFRFTIGAFDNALLAFWEPGAPTFEERLACLELAYRKGFKTSVSSEPMLDTPNVVALFHKLTPFVTDSIWLGKLNRIRNCVENKSPEVEAAIQRIEKNQTGDRIRAIYQSLKGEPLVRWKESVKKVIGLKLADEAGMDV